MNKDTLIVVYMYYFGKNVDLSSCQGDVSIHSLVKLSAEFPRNFRRHSDNGGNLQIKLLRSTIRILVESPILAESPIQFRYNSEKLRECAFS